VAKKRSAARLDREIAANLSAQGQPQLAALFADPEARATFAKEMRHEIQKQQASQRTAAGLAARPFVVKHVERGRSTMFGRYATEAEARAQADKRGGWVETRDGRVVYGVVKEP
jgi:hypothetical protein